jgi:hypothetical protein
MLLQPRLPTDRRSVPRLRPFDKPFDSPQGHEQCRMAQGYGAVASPFYRAEAFGEGLSSLQQAAEYPGEGEWRSGHQPFRISLALEWESLMDLLFMMTE